MYDRTENVSRDLTPQEAVIRELIDWSQVQRRPMPLRNILELTRDPETV